MLQFLVYSLRNPYICVYMWVVTLHIKIQNIANSPEASLVLLLHQYPLEVNTILTSITID